MAAGRPRVFTIAAGTPFLPTLADALLAGRLAPLDPSDPLAMADATVLLPTRRAVRAFRDVLAARLGNAILPAIRPLGDIDEEDHLLEAPAETAGEAMILPPAISFLDRRLALTRLILAWRRQVARAFHADTGLGIPASAADAARLAGDLARLGDDMAIAGIAWDKVGALTPGDHAEAFAITLDFLKIVAERWPDHLAETGRADPAARRDRLIRDRAAALAAMPPEGPFVIAGSTGSMPATAALISAVANLADGAVVLPGLDRIVDDGAWAAIGDAEGPAVDAHPQFALKQLLTTVGIARQDVVELAAAEPSPRAALLAQAMRPAATVDAWSGFVSHPDALAGAALIVGRNEQEEAAAIALAIREAIESPATVALVTPDRAIARRVAAELGRWGLAVDDSAGRGLDREAAGVLAALVAETAAEATPVRLLAIAKHLLAAFGMARPICRRAARALELTVLRGHRIAAIAELPVAVRAVRTAMADGGRQPRWRKRIGDADWRLAEDLADAMAVALAPLAAALASAEITAAEACGRLRDALAAVAADAAGSDADLWETPAGAALDGLLTDIAGEDGGRRLTLPGAEFPAFLGALMGDVVVPAPVREGAVHIWGTLEARLQSVDLMILGGLDEGVWPAETRTDPWLSRSMRAELGLPPPERRTGLAAHDFAQALSAPRVIVTRAQKRGGSPTVESRWLQRLRALAGEAAFTVIEERGGRYVGWARRMDDPGAKPKPADRPDPKPPLAARPRSLSVTEIETLIRDPYAIYARHVLRLEKLEALGAELDAALRGTLVHEAIGKFTGEWRGGWGEAARERLMEIGRETLAAVADAADLHAVWSLRFAAIAGWLIGWEAGRAGRVVERHAEVAGALEIPLPDGAFTLRGRADRIDRLADHTLAIYDFKTGTPQSERSVFAGVTPQMTLEAAMARHGAFTPIPAGLSVSDLAWLAIGKVGRADPYQSAVLRNETADGLAERAYALLTGLMTAFADPARGYVSRARPMMERARYLGDYDHLARVREWALLESEEDVAT